MEDFEKPYLYTLQMINVPLASQGLELADIEIIKKVLDSGQHTMGQSVSTFEKEFATKLGASFAVMVNSGSSANLLALEAIIRPTGQNHVAYPPGSYIAVPAILWPTTLWPIIQLGYKALLIDCEPLTLRIDLEKLKQAKEQYGKKLVGAFLIHPLGSSLDLKKIEDIRAGSDFFIIEDNCESLGAGNHGKYAGTVGDLGTFSFYFSHHITTIEGGMVVTQDEKRYNDLCSMRAHGWIRNRSDRKQIEESNLALSPEFLFYSSGFNFRPMEFQGAVGSSQLKRLDDFIKIRLENVRNISDRLNSDKIQIIDMNTFSHNNNQVIQNSAMAIPFLLSKDVDRGYVRKILSSHGVDSRPIIAGNFIHQPAAKNVDVEVFESLGNAEYIHNHGFMIGNHHNFTSEQVNQISIALEAALN
jgi:CDP-6-deoxy-D-xylo-4-hexulose-3-dehydrase